MKLRINRRPGQKPIGFILITTLPTFFLAIFFIVVPTIRAFTMSLTNSTMLNLNTAGFVGLDNYIYMLKDKNFLQALRNTLALMLVVPLLTIFISLVLASILTQSHLKEKGLYRVLFFLPSVISLTVVGIVWSFVFHPTMGILNTLMEHIGLGTYTRSWLGDASTALWCLAVVLIWQAAGYYMIMHIAAIDGLSPDLYDAASIDGANGVDKLFRLTLPLIKNIVGITYVLSLSGTLGLSYILSRVMTGGGPNGASTVLLQYIYTMGFKNGSYGYAMALTVFTTILSVLLSVASQLLVSRSKGGQ
ncbi:sugar ABC transporter permease [Oscillospiraceae bacterium HV4-5-C5C]|nr:sugar ABC transporter permease [Oscillospiraceae bacterium HV4-5-C5C]